jgi:uncharacterized protein involved in exopolysaccharide biosynthesis
METPLPQASARDIAFILFKHKWSILVILLGTLLCSIAYLWFVRDDVYAVTARVLIKIGREQSPPTTVLGAEPLVIGYRTNEVNSEIEILQSKDLLGQVIDELHLDRPSPPEPPPPGLLPKVKYYVHKAVRVYEDWQNELLIALGLRERLTPRERIMDALEQGLNVKAAKDSNVFVAALGTPYRKGGSIVLNALLDKYLVFRQQVYHNSGFAFFRGEVDQSEGELHAAEAQLQHFENQADISLLAKQEEVLLDGISRERALVSQAEIARNEAQLKVRKLEGELREPEPNFGSIGDFPSESFQQNILNQLAELQREREKLRLTEFDTGERVRNNRQQFQALSTMLEANLRSALAEKESSLESHQKSLEGMETDLRSRHAKAGEWLALKRKVEDLEGNYTAYSKKMSETRADGDMREVELGNVSIIDRPIDPITPIGLRKTTLLGISMLVALFVALAWVAVAEFFDQCVYTAEQTQKYTGAPVLAQIPYWRRA